LREDTGEREKMWDVRWEMGEERRENKKQQKCRKQKLPGEFYFVHLRYSWLYLTVR
jgi:hypothetical protein